MKKLILSIILFCCCLGCFADEPVEVLVLMRNHYTIAPNIKQINAPLVWAQGNEGQDVVIAVIDTGVNYNHSDIADHLWDKGGTMLGNSSPTTTSSFFIVVYRRIIIDAILFYNELDSIKVFFSLDLQNIDSFFQFGNGYGPIR